MHQWTIFAPSGLFLHQPLINPVSESSVKKMWTQLLYKQIYVLYHICELRTHIITMKHKSISTQSAGLLAYFNERNKSCFSFAEASQALPDSNETAVRKLLSDMTKRGLLMRLKDGLFILFHMNKMQKSSSRIGIQSPNF